MAPSTFAQAPPVEERSADQAEDADAPAADQDARSESEMDKMATTVTRMAQMCEQMMAKDMRMMPWKMAAGLGLGTVVAIDLLLLMVLEVQWIIYWWRRLRS